MGKYMHLDTYSGEPVVTSPEMRISGSSGELENGEKCMVAQKTPQARGVDHGTSSDHGINRRQGVPVRLTPRASAMTEVAMNRRSITWKDQATTQCKSFLTGYSSAMASVPLDG